MLHFSSISYFISSLKRKKNRPTDKHTPNFSCLYIVILTYIEGKKSCLFSGGNSFLFFNQTTHFFPSLRIMWRCWENSLACKSHSTESISLDFGGRPWLGLCVCVCARRILSLWCSTRSSSKSFPICNHKGKGGRRRSRSKNKHSFWFSSYLEEMFLKVMLTYIK